MNAAHAEDGEVTARAQESRTSEASFARLRLLMKMIGGTFDLELMLFCLFVTKIGK